MVIVANLQNSINNISSSFAQVQANISSINQLDSQQNLKLNQNLIVDGNQQADIVELQEENDQDMNRLTSLENKFPITNISILDETINKAKIKDLTSDLANINNTTNNLQSQITLNNVNTTTSIDDLNTSLNNHILK